MCTVLCKAPRTYLLWIQIHINKRIIIIIIILILFYIGLSGDTGVAHGFARACDMWRHLLVSDGGSEATRRRADGVDENDDDDEKQVVPGNAVNTRPGNAVNTHPRQRGQHTPGNGVSTPPATMSTNA